VLADPETLTTLPTPHLRAGLAEAIKHGVIADERYFERVVHDLSVLLNPRRDGWIDAITAVVVRSVEIKADVVDRDEREAGLRKTLNFGHTLGHAIERCTNYQVLHGEAVAAGMVLESDLAERAGIADSGTLERVRDAVRAAGLATDRPSTVAPEQLLAATRTDKKARRGAVEYALPRRVGAMAGGDHGWACPVADDLVLEVLK
jgi:3-dehydroquinate synthase